MIVGLELALLQNSFNYNNYTRFADFYLEFKTTRELGNKEFRSKI